MSDRTPFDEMRDLLDGRLDPAAAAELRARIAADPALAADFESMSDVLALTAPAAVAPPATNVTLASMEAALRRGPVHRLRPWIAAAAAVLVVATAGAAVWHHWTPRTVTLHAISLQLTTPAFVSTPGDVPAALADYRPVADGRMRWIDSLDTGRRVAQATNRPILLWVYHPQCPLCTALDRGAFRDAAIEAKVAEFVPVRVDVMTAPEDVQRLAEKGWPYFGVLSPEGTPVAEFPGPQSKKDFASHLTEAIDARATTAPAVAWDVAGDAAAAIRRGVAALGAKRYADAHREFTAARVRSPGGLLGNAANAGLADVALRAAEALLGARKLAETDEAAGARSLSEATESFRGTPYGSDLAEVEQELRATGRFPVLVEAKE